MKQNLLQQMTARMPEFSKGQRLIAQYILNHYDRAAYMTASRLGSLVAVSESTVVRFANELGFAGYPEMQRALQELAKTNLTAAQRMQVADNLLDKNNILDHVLQADADKIRHTLDAIDRDAFYGAVEKIVAARNIYILGVRSSAALADFLTFNFRMMFDNVRAVEGTTGTEIFEQLLDIGPEDVFIAISFPRYSKRTVRAVEFAHRAGADVVALTDSATSPLAPESDQLLTARSDMASFVDSLVAPLSIINAMVAAVSMRKHDEVTDRLHRLERIWDEYDVYDKNS
ncbi:MAG: MurR/RpiR family transcriptional regulator [Clostridia bacterium]|nr:MurR/RpiR family transcriptional regulator [Oscillospiraceae bacterium]MBQ2773944.1 MurR/RpiR family transcriptional regulator [Clostridia bacterium]MBQ3056588.1 MurR/RpiR family transcriptional regulator [Clostridia bacterium]